MIEFYGRREYHKIYKKIDWDEWLNQPGEPPVKYEISSPYIDDAKKLARDYIKLGGQSSPVNYTRFNNFYARAKVITLDELVEQQSNVTFEIMRRLENDF